MSDLKSVETRLAQALDRLESAFAQPRPVADTSEVEALRQKLAEAQTQVSAQSTQIADMIDQTRLLTQEADQRNTAIGALERGLAELRAANEALGKTNAALTDGDGGADKALRAELASLKADRMAEQAEVAALLVALGPLVEDSENA